MKPAEANLLKYLKKSDQLAIAIYQRTYGWRRQKCLELGATLCAASNEEAPAHFIGSIVYIDTGIFQVTSETVSVVLGRSDPTMHVRVGDVLGLKVRRSTSKSLSGTS